MAEADQEVLEFPWIYDVTETCHLLEGEAARQLATNTGSGGQSLVGYYVSGKSPH